MRKRFLSRLFITIASLLCLMSQAFAEFNNDDWNSVLKQYVNEHGYVDYQALNNNRAQFDRYVQLIKSTGPKSNPQLFSTQNDKLAFYINAYNALVFEGVLNRGPEDKSVWRGLVSGYNFFVRMDVIIDGETTNLKKLNNQI